MPAIKTYGLTHVAFVVRDLRRASKFYKDVFGAVEVYNEDGVVQLQTPGTRDVIVLEEKHGAAASAAGMSGGIAHFGFRLVDPGDIEAAARAVSLAGGTVLSQGEFVPGEPYLFARDPDGYEIEIWFELPTKVDPPARPARARRRLPRAPRAGRRPRRRSAR
jgi:catechol 2,3-dioxygenase-like lactoylglutathione lyase family enzyme